MRKVHRENIYSGAIPEEVAKDLQPLVDFQEDGISLYKLHNLIKENLLKHLMHYDCPGFQSMFNAFPEKGAKLGAEFALSYNQGVTGWQVSPGGATLEELACRALCKMFRLSSTADATVMYSGTYANQEALFLALHRHAEKSGFDYSQKGLKGFKNIDRLTVLTSSDSHFSINLALRMLGLGEENLISIPADNNRRMDIDKFNEIFDDIKKKKDIFCIVATAGTTATGSVDPVNRIADFSEEINTWLHVDGAYGLAYSLVPEYSHLFEGIERADSICWDPHKQFGVPIPNSILFVKQRNDFFRIAAYGDYFNRKEDPEPNPGLKSPPTTRPFSALPLVTSIRYQGMRKLVKRLRSSLTAISKLAHFLEKESDIELFHKPDLGILCFRIVPEGVPINRLDHLQEHIYNSIMCSGKRTIAKTRLDGKTVLRMVVISPKVKLKTLKETIEVIRNYASGFSG